MEPETSDSPLTPPPPVTPWEGGPRPHLIYVDMRGNHHDLDNAINLPSKELAILSALSSEANSAIYQARARLNGGPVEPPF